jgi:hypothetical protein
MASVMDKIFNCYFKPVRFTDCERGWQLLLQVKLLVLSLRISYRRLQDQLQQRTGPKFCAAAHTLVKYLVIYRK